MNDSDEEKYLGDLVNKSGKIKATMDDRIAKGYGIITEIKAILNEVPLARYKLEMGLQLRQAILINGLLFNSEAWHSVTEKDIKGLAKIDESLLRFLLGSQSKAPIEMLFLESGAIPIPQILSSCRMIFFQTLMKREDKELTKRILNAQINSSCPGDFIQLVKADFKCLEVPLDINLVESTGIEQFKKFIKIKVKAAGLRRLKRLQQTHSKVMNKKYEELELHPT